METAIKENKGKKQKKELKERGSEYFWLAMYAFGGLGIEVLYAFWLEPMIYGHEMNQFTTSQSLLHWTVTCITWLIVIFLILRYAKNKLDFDIRNNQGRVKPIGWIVSILVILFITIINCVDTGTVQNLKIVREFGNLGPLKFVFQHLYYLVEIGLVTLILVFGQIAMEKWFKKIAGSKENIPYGGIVVGLTWGLVHWLTKSSWLMGVEGLALGFLFGSIYLLLSRDIRKTYVVLAIAFIL